MYVDKLLVTVVIGIALLGGTIYFGQKEKAAERAAIAEQLKDCTYIGSRYDIDRKIYRYRCGETIEEIRFKL